jgi:hypothetical protein
LFAAGKGEHGESQQTQGADRDPKQLLPNIHRLNPTRAGEILGETNAW